MCLQTASSVVGTVYHRVTVVARGDEPRGHEHRAKPFERGAQLRPTTRKASPSFPAIEIGGMAG